ncbi:hypothetical protein [uncultured Sphingomonas sp.]
MKAVLFALIVLVAVDAFANHGAGFHSFIAALTGFGQGVGAWVFSTG